VKTARSRWSATANLYWMQYRDQLVLDGRINDVGAYIRTNVPESYRAGIELEASLQVGRRWHLAANGAWSRNKVAHFTEYRDNWDTGAQETIEYHNTDLAFSPNFIGRLEVGFDCLPQQTKHALSITLSGKYVSQQYLDNTSNALTALDAFGFADLRLNYDLKKVLGKQISLLCSINNLLNAQYAPNGWTYRFTSPSYDPRPDDPYTRSEGNGTYHQAGFFPQAGRYWMATLRCAL
jgi:iron complex outermembrane recepter protein